MAKQNYQNSSNFYNFVVFCDLQNKDLNSNVNRGGRYTVTNSDLIVQDIYSVLWTQQHVQHRK